MPSPSSVINDFYQQVYLLNNQVFQHVLYSKILVLISWNVFVLLYNFSTICRCTNLPSEMTVLSFFGCAFTAYGPALSLFLFTIASDPVKIIILILSAFFWLLSLLLSSVLWLIVSQFSVSKTPRSQLVQLDCLGRHCHRLSLLGPLPRDFPLSDLPAAGQGWLLP